MDYLKYRFTGRELAMHLFIVSGCMIVIAKLFFTVIECFLFLFPFHFPIMKYRQEQLKEKRKKN